MTTEQIVLAQIRKNIAKLSPSDRVRVEAIAQTLRNVVKGGGVPAAYAFWLVGVELAAE